MVSKFNPKLHYRRSLRLKNYDYSQLGLYFITISTQNKTNLFCKIIENKMILNIAGKMVAKIWLEIPKIFSNTKLHEYVIMPNHFHAPVQITNTNKFARVNPISTCFINSKYQTIPVGADSISVPFVHAIPEHTDDGMDIKNGVNIKSNCNGNNRNGVGNVSLPKIVQTFKRYTTIEYIKCVCDLFYDAGKIDFFPDELNKLANIFYTGI